MIDYVTLLKGLGENLIILLSLPFIYHLSNSKLARRTIKKQGLLVGILFGLIAVMGMLFSVKIRPGVLMDGRIIVAIAGLFGGACSAIPAIIMILLCQFWIGGEWMLPGMGASISGAILGVLAHWGFKNKFEQIRSHHLLLLGFLLGATGWVWNLGYRDESIQSFFLQVMVLYPLSTLILSHLILSEKKRSAFEQALAQSAKEYRTLVDEMPDIRYRSDLDGNISFVSKAGYAMFGYTPAEAIGMNLTKIYVDPKERKNYITQLQEKGEVSDFQTQLRHKDGTIRWGSTNARLFRDSQGEPIGIEGITRDVTRSKRRDDLKAAQLRLVEYGMNHSVVQILQKITDEAEALTNSSIGFFHFLEEDQNSILRQAWSTRTHRHCGSDVHQFHLPVEQAGRWADCIRSRQPVIQNNYQALSHKSGLPEGHAPLERFMVIPIIREDKVKAILGLGNKAFDYDDLDEDILRQLATFAWEIVVRKQAEKALLDREAN